MRGAIPPLPHYAFTAWCLVKKHRNFMKNGWQIKKTEKKSKKADRQIFTLMKKERRKKERKKERKK
jgi:hypothetical protein